jgi:hypothetical protein
VAGLLEAAGNGGFFLLMHVSPPVVWPDRLQVHVRERRLMIVPHGTFMPDPIPAP